MKTNQKPNPQITRSLEEDVVFYKREVTKAETVLTLKAHPGWQALTDDVRDKLDGVETELDNFEGLTERQLVLCLKERKDFRWMVSLANKVEEALPQLHNALADAQKKLEERKAKLANEPAS